MYVLFVVFNKMEYLRQTLNKMKDIGITGATIIDSVGSGTLIKSIGKDIPLIAGLMKSLDAEVQRNKTLFTVIDTKEKLEYIMDEIEKICGGDMSKPHTGIMFAIPVEYVRGGSISRLK